MENVNQYQYYAFISYKREDEKHAKWLQNRLMHYKLPVSIREAYPELPTNVHPVFRDTTDLSGGVLSDEICKALDSSRYLIVICSPRAAQSQWVCKEVDHFINSGREKYIIPYIVEGVPNSGDVSSECFPVSLRGLVGNRELLGVNINEMGRDAAAIKVVARMFDLRFDVLWRRWERDRRRRKLLTVLGGILAAVIVIATLIFIAHKEIEKTEYQIRSISEIAMRLIDEGDSYTAAKLALEALPGNLKRPNKPLLIEAEKALRNATQYKSIIYKGHIKPVVSVCYSQDGKTMLSAAYDGTIKIWDVATGLVVREIGKQETGREEIIYATLSADGRYVAASMGNPAENSPMIDWNSTIVKIWDLHKGDCREIIQCDDYFTSRCVAFSPNGKYLAIASDDRTIQLRDLGSGDIIKTYNEHDWIVTYVAFSPNGKYLVSSSYDSSVKVWEVEGDNSEPIKTYFKEPKSDEGCLKVWSAEFSNDGKYIVAAYDDAQFAIWDFGGGCDDTSPIKEHSKYVNHASFSYRNTDDVYSPYYVATASGDGTCKVFFNGYLCEETFGKEKYQMNYVRFSPDNQYVAMAVGDGTVCQERLQDENVSIYVNNKYTSARFSQDGRYLILTETPRTEEKPQGARVFDVSNSKNPTEKFTHCKFKSVSISYDSKYLVATSGDNRVQLWLLETEELLYEFNEHLDLVNDVAFGISSHCIASVSNDKSIKLWGADNTEEVLTLDGHSDEVCNILFSKDDKYVLSESKDATIRLWDIGAKRCVKTFEWSDKGMPVEHSAIFSSDCKSVIYIKNDYDAQVFDLESLQVKCTINNFLSLSQDGKSALAFTDDNILEIRSMKDGNIQRKLNGSHICDVYSASFSPDGKYIVSSCEDSIIRIWDVESGEMLQTLKGHKDWVYEVMFSPNSKYILSLSGDETAKFWRFKTLQELIDETYCRFESNPLTDEERQKYFE